MTGWRPAAETKTAAPWAQSWVIIGTRILAPPMGWLTRAALLSGLASVVATGVVRVEARQQPPAPPSTPSSNGVPHPPEQFVGLWAYNPDESINAATGRPEQSPRSATQRTPAGRTGGAGANAGGQGSPGVASAGGGFSSFGGNDAGGGRGRSGAGDLGPTVAMIQENRSIRRDLMEVPESLTIRVAGDVVTFVDDLKRERTYLTTGLKQRYMLGAARFNAAAQWVGSQLLKLIDAADGFRMTETYFLSEDAKRLFVIIRVGSDRKGAPVMGVNRVYDRVVE